MITNTLRNTHPLKGEEKGKKVQKDEKMGQKKCSGTTPSDMKRHSFLPKRQKQLIIRN